MATDVAVFAACVSVGSGVNREQVGGNPVADVQQDLIRASAVARLSRIASGLMVQRDVSTADRHWFAELLYPVANQSTANARLQTTEVSFTEASAILEVLLQDYDIDHDEDRLEREIKLLIRLRGELEQATPHNEELVRCALRFTKRLTDYFLAAVSPSAPGSSLAG